MNRTVRRRATISTAVVLAAAALFVPTASYASATPASIAAETSPVSHLGISPGSDETQLSANWFTSSTVTEAIQIAPASAQTGAEFPAEAAASFDAVMAASQDREGLQTAKATVTGLEANTDYVYRVGSEEHGWSATYTYSTEAFGDSFSFNFYGDAQLGSGSSTEIGAGTGLEEDAQGWYQTLDTSVEMYPDSSFLFHAGDQIDGYGDDGQLEEILGDRDPQYDAFFAEGADTIREVPLATLSGNHDDEGYTYDEFFNMPNSEGRSYWYEYNNALVIGLDINTISIYDYFAIAQLETEEEKADYYESLRPAIEAGIERATEFTNSVIAERGDDADWIIVGFHQSPFSQANHYYDPDIEIMREGFTQSLSDAGVDLVLGGHDHIYTRTHLMEGSTPVVPEEEAGIGDVLEQEDGQVLYLTGNSSSGSKFYDFMDLTGNDDPATADTSQTHPSTAVWDQQYKASFSNIEIDGDSLTVNTHHTVDGALIDQVTLVQSDDSGEPTGSGEPSGSGEPTGSETPTEDDDSASPKPSTTDGTAAPTNGAGDREDNDDDLAQTGSSDLIMIGAIALALVASGATVYAIRRKQQA